MIFCLFICSRYSDCCKLRCPQSKPAGKNGEMLTRRRFAVWCAITAAVEWSVWRSLLLQHYITSCYLDIPTTSMISERQFSAAGWLISQ